MKLFSTNRNSKGRQLVCDDAVFDPNLMLTLRVDEEEKVVTFQYDFAECGHPLNLPFDVQSVDFLVKFTKHDIHICAIAEPGKDFDEQYEEFVGDMGDVEFDVRMSTEEKYALLLSLFIPLLSKIKTKEKTKEPTKGAATSNVFNKNKLPDEKTMKDAMATLFQNFFREGSSKDNQ